MKYKLKIFTKKFLARLFKFLGLSSIFSFLGCSTILSFITGGDNPYVCMYGVPDNFIEIDGTVYGDIDGDGKEEPVPDIKVSSPSQNNEVFTNSEGHFYYSSVSYDDSLTLIFTDTDGKENGDFKTQSKDFNLLNSKYYPDEKINLENK